MAKNGGLASIFVNKGTSQAFTDEACTRVGSTLEFYISARASPDDKSWWDPQHVPVVKVDGVATIPDQIDYAAGMFTLPAYSSGAVTVSGYYFETENLGGGYGFDIENKSDKIDITTFPAVLNTATLWRSYISSLMEWSAKISRHFWYGRAWCLMDASGADCDLIWTCKSYGTPGNIEQVRYVEGGALEVARVNHVTTVTFVAATTTAAQIKAHVEADPVLAAFWEVTYPGLQAGSGVVSAISAVTCSGGRDHSSDIARLGENVLVRFYLDVTDSSLEIVSGVGTLVGVPRNCKLDGIIEADLALQGDGRLKYHTV